MSSSEVKPNCQKDLIFDLLKENKIEEALKYVKEGNLDKNIDCLDEHGTTPLQYAVRIEFHIQLFKAVFNDLCFLIKKGISWV
jgi:hypothetical protein